MPTTSFFKNIVIDDKKVANSFLNALENAERKNKRISNIDEHVKTIKDGQIIKKMFKK